jgi:tol-pal system protein YbgF
MSRFSSFSLVCAGILGLFALAPRSSAAQSMAELQTKVDTNNRQVAEAVNAMNEIRQEFRSVKGTLENSDYIRKETDRVYQDLDQRVSGLEDRIGQLHNLLKDLNTKLTPAAPGTAPSAAAPTTSSQEVADFQSLLNVANARDYRSAASGFMGFVKKYPKSEMNGSAQYWVAESFYSMGDYAKAISEYQILATKYPQHPRVKEAIYKQGLSFQKLNKSAEAKLFYQKAISAYPGSAEAYLAQGRLTRLEEMEKTQPQVALNPPGSPQSPSTQAPTSGPSANRPIMKPNPMPRAPLPAGTPAPQSPAPLPPDTAKDTGSSSAPLF